MSLAYLEYFWDTNVSTLLLSTSPTSPALSPDTPEPEPPPNPNILDTKFPTLDIRLEEDCEVFLLSRAVDWVLASAEFEPVTLAPAKVAEKADVSLIVSALLFI